MSIANLGLRFVVELLAIVALGYWGFAALDGTPWRFVAGIGAPVVLVVVWALVVAPNADNALQPRTQELIGTGLLLVAAAALARAGQPVPAAVLAATVLDDQVLLIAINPGARVALLPHAGPRG